MTKERFEEIRDWFNRLMTDGCEQYDLATFAEQCVPELLEEAFKYQCVSH